MLETVVIDTKDGCCEARIFTSSPSPRPGIVFYMDAFAIRPALFAMAQRMADFGYTVLLPDLYYRNAPYAQFDPTTTLGDPNEHKRIIGLLGTLDNDRLRMDAEAFVGWMAQSDRVTGPIGAVGYCIGGRAAVFSAAASSRVKAVAAIHGTQLATEGTDSAHLSLISGKAAAYIAIAGIDDYFTSVEEGRLAAALREGAVDHVIENYRGVQHGFAINDARHYDSAAAERHWRRLETFFAETIRE